MTVKVHIYVYVLGQGREELMKDSVADSGEGPPRGGGGGGGGGGGSGEGPPLPPPPPLPLSYLKVWIRHWN